MKYIRTKDGRISYLSQEPYEDMDCYEIITSKGTITYRREDEVIKVADTIEELCDWFLTIVNGRIHTYSVDFEYAKSHLFLFEKCESVEIKGAIETDKGLIYVAKMNDKGELELL
jgi:hypothetical protein